MKTEIAHNVLAFLGDSKLVQVNDGTEASLRQDRYSIRTAPQWLGPTLEDLTLAHQQLSIECNCATDNPLVSPEGAFLHGGNFQAKAVTAAMEKTRQGMQAIGRMLFTQCVEMINSATSRGLPPNLVAENPSASYIFKGTDLNVAALQAELGFLSTPVNHVQSAEMGNQALNSLALISARYTHTSIEVLSQMMAAHLIAVFQALDLRAMHVQYLENYRPQFQARVTDVFKKYSDTSNDVDILSEALWQQLLTAFNTTVSMNAKDRFPLHCEVFTRYIHWQFQLQDWGRCFTDNSDFYRTPCHIAIRHMVLAPWRLSTPWWCKSGPWVSIEAALCFCTPFVAGTTSVHIEVNNPTIRKLQN